MVEAEPGITRSAFLRRSAELTLSASALSAVLGCGGDGSGARAGNPQAGTPAQGRPPRTPTGVLRVALPAPPFSLDPAVTATQGDRAIVHTVFDGLVRYNEDYTELLPSLAEAWEENDEATEWVLRLRPDVTFHDGEPLDSTAVKQNLRHFQQGTLSQLFLPAKLAVLDDSDPKVLRVASPDPYPDFIRNQVVLGLISPKLIRQGSEAINRRPVGTGAYRFVSYREGRGTTLEANSSYWGDGPYYERVEFPIIQEEGSRINALLTDQVEIYPKVLPTQIGRLRGDDVRRVSTQTWSGVYLAIVTNRPGVRDVRVRQAIAYAVDKEAIVRAIARGQGEVAHAMAPTSTVGYAEPKTRYDHDPARARELLAEAGAEGLELRMLVSPAQYLGPSVSRAVAAQLEEVGLRVKVDVVDPAIQGREFSRASTEPAYDIFTTDHYWLTGGPFIQAFLPTTTGYQGDDLAKAIAKVQTTPNGPEREQAFAAFEELRSRLVLYYPLFYSTFSDGLQASIQDYHSPKDGFMPVLAPVYAPA